MKFGHRLHGKITAYDDKGRGTFELGSQDAPTTREITNAEGETTGKYVMGKGTVAIPFSAVGDDIEATFLKRDSGVKVAKIETINTPGPDRVTAPCPHAGVCGGCLWQHLDYSAQLRLKKEMINRAFEKAGHEERIADVTPSVDQLYYRNRMDYVVGWLGQVGLKEYGSWNRYLDLSTCLLLNENAAEVMSIVRGLIKEFDLEPWDAVYHTGLVRYVVMRDGKNTNEHMIMLVVSDAEKLTEPVRAALLERLGKFATTLLIGIQALPTDLSYVQSTIALKGNPWLEEEVNGVRYRIAPNSFFQTNTKMAAKLQDEVLKHTDGAKKLLDLYCGLGFFGIAAAKRDASLTVNGFEIDAEAISLATLNATTNNVNDRTTFASGPAEDLSWKDIEADTIIVDPPRAGLHPRVVKTLLEKEPKTIVYVSCNFHHLVDELKELKTKYKIESLTALDLFPQTPHVEVVTKLVRLDAAA